MTFQNMKKLLSPVYIAIFVICTACGSHSDKVDSSEEEVSDENVSLVEDYVENNPVGYDTVVELNSEEFECQGIQITPTLVPEFYKLVQIISIEQIDQCLLIKFQYSGCNMGEAALNMKAVGARGKKAADYSMALVIKNSGDCEMLMQDQAYFDMSKHGQGPEGINLNFENGFKSIYRSY
jgi:hypothetical protein